MEYHRAIKSLYLTMRIRYIFVLYILIFLIGCTSTPTSLKPNLSQDKIDGYLKKVIPLLKDKYNQEVILFVDLTKPSGEYRFFIIDIKKSKVLDAGLTCNGVTDKDGNTIYSNRPGSNASSKGLYKIGYSYTGRFGKAYKLHGLSKTNSNAFARAVVLHSYVWVPPLPIPFKLFESQGCPTVHPDFLKQISKYINESRKPLLLYIQ